MGKSVLDLLHRLGNGNNSVHSSAVLATTIAVHTLEEAFQVPSYQQQLLQHRAANIPVTTKAAVLLDSLPLFVLLPVAAYLARFWRAEMICDSLATVAVVHPWLDHVVLSWRLRHWRPGSLTALGFLFPLGLSRLLNGSRHLVGCSIGFLISILLYFAAVAEMREWGV